MAAINADPEVMRHFPATQDRAETAAALARITARMDERGYGLWCVEVKGGPACIGFTGLNLPSWQAPFGPLVEVGWRLARSAWGLGYATEAALAALRHGFGTMTLDEIVAFTVPGNTRSIAVMRRLGMSHEPADDFDHPVIAEGHPLRRHVLYRLRREDYRPAPLVSES